MNAILKKIVGERAQESMAMGVRLTKRCSAFTMIEIIAVLAILAILAAALAPALVKQADFAAQTVEATNLVAIANGLQQACLRQKYIPGTGDWAGIIASNIGWQTSAVQTNSRHNARFFLPDPNLSITGGLPYAQNAPGASTMPANVKFMILSSMAGFPLPSLGSGDFDILWTNLDNTIPTGSKWSNFKQGSDLQIQRVNLSSFFHHVTIYSPDPVNTPLTFIGQGYGPNMIQSAVPVLDAYFIEGTTVTLFFPGSLRPELTQVLEQDCSWTFQCGVWRATTPPVDLQGIVQTFYSNPHVQHGVSSGTVCQDMNNYMVAYTNYVASGSGHSALQSYQAALASNINLLSAP